MIDVTIVGGFLGAGKTTWLSRVLERPTAPDAKGSRAVVVNDYASVGVDDWLLSSASMPGDRTDIRLVAGGCVCCDKQEELVSCLLSMAESRHRADQTGTQGIEQIFIETSGVADPRTIVDLITRHPVLQANLVLKELVVVVDSLNGRSQLRHQELARAQLRCADRIVFSKSDLAEDGALASLAATITHLNPAAQLSRAVDGRESPLPASLATSPVGEVLVEPWDTDGTFTPKAWTAQLSPGISWPEYALWLDALIRAHPQRIHRTKGIIHTPNGPIVLQSVGTVIAQPRTAPPTDSPGDPGPTSMVFITEGVDLDQLARSLAAFVPSAAENSHS